MSARRRARELEMKLEDLFPGNAVQKENMLRNDCRVYIYVNLAILEFYMIYMFTLIDFAGSSLPMHSLSFVILLLAS